MNRLKELRTKYKLSLRKLQEYTGIDFSRLAIIEKTEANLESKTVDKLTNFFKVSDTYFFGKDGFIYYYDEVNKKFFPMAYEQYKNVLTDEVVSYSIVNGCVRRNISIEGYERINKIDNVYTKALQSRITTERYIDELNKMDDYEFKRQKERLLEYIQYREIKMK